MKVGVFAGTKVDTEMGNVLLKEKNVESLLFPISKNPEEQSKMQYSSKEELEEIFYQKAMIGKKDGMEKIFLYCNSLASAIDLKRLEERLEMEIITPLDTYKNLDKKIKNLVILTANGVSAYMIDKIIKENNENINTITIGNLSIVNLIEKNISPKELIDKLALDKMINYLENIKQEDLKIDSILLGCTHFPYFKEEIKKITKLNIIDPAEDMLKRI